MFVPRLTGFALACLALVLITAIGASAVTIYTKPASDGMVWYYNTGHAPSPEQGVNTMYSYACVTNWEHPVGGYNYTREISKGVFEFPISSLSGVTLPVNSAKLHIYFQSNTTLPVVDLYGFCYDGGGTITYEGGPITSITSLTPAASTWREVDVTADLQRQINAGYAWAGFRFAARYVVDDTRVAYISTYEDSAYRPHLDVIPESSSLLALGSGLLALCGVLRRRR